MSNWHTFAERECGNIEVLRTRTAGSIFGYRVVGAKVGPQVVVAGCCDETKDVFERLLAIPTLPRLRGNLVLVMLDALDDISSDISSIESIGYIDRTIMLTDSSAEGGGEQLKRRNFYMILRTCTELGMISGRGVTTVYDALEQKGLLI